MRKESFAITGMCRPAILFCALLGIAMLWGCGNENQGATSITQEVETIATVRAKLRTNLNDPELRLRLARLYMQERDGASAESHLRRALKLGTGDTDAPLDLVRSLLLQDNYFDAHEMTEKLLDTAGNNAPARLWMLRGEAQLGLSHFSTNGIRQSFINAFHAQTRAGSSRTVQRLEQLTDSHPIVAAARGHAECGNRDVLFVDPPSISSASLTGRVIQVGPTREITTPSAATKIAVDGDVIEIDAGVYRGDVASWYQNDITLRGVGGIAYLEAAGRHSRGQGIWVFEGNNITAENIGFSGAKVPDRNGAGIRLNGKGATIRNCHFENNENGILGSNIEANDVVVEFSTFVDNGYGDGQSHNLYIGRARSFIMRYSYSQGAHVGHLVKSRAHKNTLLFNRFVDGEDGDSSYVIDLPEGGQAWIIGNELQQGPNARNPVMISFGQERSNRDYHQLFVVNNTFYNRLLDGTFIHNGTDIDAVVTNNIFAGAPGFALIGPGVTNTNLLRPGPWFKDARALDFALTNEAPAIDTAVEPSTIKGLRYMPDAEYRHPARGQLRRAVGLMDIGAREFCGL